MLCEKCHMNEADIHLKELGGKSEATLHLCLSCAGQAFAHGQAGRELDFAKLLQDFAACALAGSSTGQRDEDDDQTVCPVCGLGSREFRQQGKVGCGACYQAFADDIAAVLGDLHRGVIHRGSRPSEGDPVAAVGQGNRGLLELQLARAVAEEAFERAAELRDALQLLGD